jgi:hypothetical protein
MPIVHEVPKPCQCPGKPDPNEYGCGTIWECSLCGTHYEVKYDYRENGNFWGLNWNWKKNDVK